MQNLLVTRPSFPNYGWQSSSRNILFLFFLSFSFTKSVNVSFFTYVLFLHSSLSFKWHIPILFSLSVTKIFYLNIKIFIQNIFFSFHSFFPIKKLGSFWILIFFFELIAARIIHFKMISGINYNYKKVNVKLGLFMLSPPRGP